MTMASSIKGTSGESLSDTISYVNLALSAAKKYHLEIEVIATAMILLKQDPKLSIVTALAIGMADWDVDGFKP